VSSFLLYRSEELVFPLLYLLDVPTLSVTFGRNMFAFIAAKSDVPCVSFTSTASQALFPETDFVLTVLFVDWYVAGAETTGKCLKLEP